MFSPCSHATRPRRPPLAPDQGREAMIQRLVVTALFVALAVAPAAAQRVPTPLEHFGFEIGADRKLANWTQLTAYYEALAKTSPRVTIDTLGRATRGQPFVMLTITSP